MKNIILIYLIQIFFLLPVSANEKLNSFSFGGVEYDVTHTWRNAKIIEPGSIFSKSLDSLDTKTPTPTILLMHGCSGIYEGDWASFFKSKGYVVVMPDSFAIPNRKSNCDTKTKKTFGNIPTQILRNLEAEYAMTQLQTMPWVDKKNIFIMGHSEGGIAAWQTNDKKFNGIIVSSYHCYGGTTESSIPILAINFENDPWIGWYGHCKNNWGQRKNATQIIIKGEGHNTFGYDEVMIGVDEFIKKYSK
jgi:dienelactone hydrolase